jgi:hypothetical protein
MSPFAEFINGSVLQKLSFANLLFLEKINNENILPNFKEFQHSTQILQLEWVKEKKCFICCCDVHSPERKSVQNTRRGNVKKRSPFNSISAFLVCDVGVWIFNYRFSA